VKDFRALTNADKLGEMANVNFWRKDSHYLEEYIRALIDGNQTAIDEYESFGDEPRRIIENKAKYEQGFSMYGFTEKRFNDSGWLREADFLDCEEIDFAVNGRFKGTNSILLGRGPNGKWTHAITLSAPKSGCSSGLSVYGPIFASRNDCLKNALECFIQWHKKVDDRKTASALKEAQNMLDTMTGRKAVQMSLLDCIKQ
jgi:hypothetical protein